MHRSDERAGPPTAAGPAELIAPWWHTAAMVLLVLGLSVHGASRVHAGAPRLHRMESYFLSITYEWVLAGLALWGIRLRGIPLRQLLGEPRPGVRAWLNDLGAALIFWVIALTLLSVLGQALLRVSGSQIDPRRIGDVTERLGPDGGAGLAVFLLLSISAGVCEEFVFRGYLQRQFTRMTGRIWLGVALSALVFGCAHGYEGVAGVLLVAAYGAMFGALALLRRRLRTGMIAHAWHDAISGAAMLLLRRHGLHF